MRCVCCGRAYRGLLESGGHRRLREGIRQCRSGPASPSGCTGEPTSAFASDSASASTSCVSRRRREAKRRRGERRSGRLHRGLVLTDAPRGPPRRPRLTRRLTRRLTPGLARLLVKRRGAQRGGTQEGRHARARLTKGNRGRGRGTARKARALRGGERGKGTATARREALGRPPLEQHGARVLPGTAAPLLQRRRNERLLRYGDGLPLVHPLDRSPFDQDGCGAPRR